MLNIAGPHCLVIFTKYIGNKYKIVGEHLNLLTHAIYLSLRDHVVDYNHFVG